MGARCFFVLSTGRCGTESLTQLLSLGSNAVVEHEPFPRLNKQARDVYEGYSSRPEVFRMLIEAAKEDPIYKAYEAGLIYGETANRLTFFAPAISEVFGDSRFIHLVRDPRDVVRSGMDRGWYGSNKWDEGRIEPLPLDRFYGEWDRMSPFEKCAWFWREVNRFASEFMRSLPSSRGMFIRAEEMFRGDPEYLRSIFEFLEVEPPKPRRISAAIRKKKNVQKRRSFPDKRKWPADHHRTLERVAGEVMESMGYK